MLSSPSDLVGFGQTCLAASLSSHACLAISLCIRSASSPLWPLLPASFLSSLSSSLKTTFLLLLGECSLPVEVKEHLDNNNNNNHNVLQVLAYCPGIIKITRQYHLAISYCPEQWAIWEKTGCWHIAWAILHCPGRRLGDNTIIMNIAIHSFYSITISRTFSSYRDIEKLRLKKHIAIKKKCDCESCQKFNGNEIRTVFSAFGSEKQKRTTSEVHTPYANEFVIYCDVCRRVHTCGYQR